MGYEIVTMLWYSLYSREGNWKEEPDKHLSTVYQYLHLHRLRVDAVQQIFDGVDESGGHERLLSIVFEFIGYAAAESDGERHYVLLNAPDLLRVMIFADDED